MPTAAPGHRAKPHDDKQTNKHRTRRRVCGHISIGGSYFWLMSKSKALGALGAFQLDADLTFGGSFEAYAA